MTRPALTLPCVSPPIPVPPMGLKCSTTVLLASTITPTFHPLITACPDAPGMAPSTIVLCAAGRTLIPLPVPFPIPVDELNERRCNIDAVALLGQTLGSVEIVGYGVSAALIDGASARANRASARGFRCRIVRMSRSRRHNRDRDKSGQGREIRCQVHPFNHLFVSFRMSQSRRNYQPWRKRPRPSC